MNIEAVTHSSILRAAQLLRQGQLVAFPTETVYGLGGDATNNVAVAEIFSVKGRPQFNPLILHIQDSAMAKALTVWNDAAEKLSAAFWPGPLTLVLSILPESRISLLASAGGGTIGMRVPSHDAARALCRAAGFPIAAPSANRSGRVSPTTAHHVYDELGNAVPLILDGGACAIGIESTVIDVSGESPVLLRPGGITQGQIESVLGQSLSVYSAVDEKLKSPGMLASHYAPALPVRLNVTDPRSSEAFIAFGDQVPAGAKATYNLSGSGNLKEAAARLFAALRAHDSPHYSAIAIMPIPEMGLGIAINDRLRRAAAR